MKCRKGFGYMFKQASERLNVMFGDLIDSELKFLGAPRVGIVKADSLYREAPMYIGLFPLTSYSLVLFSRAFHSFLPPPFSAVG